MKVSWLGTRSSDAQRAVAVIGIMLYGMMWVLDADPQKLIHHSELVSYVFVSVLIGVVVVPAALTKMLERLFITVLLGALLIGSGIGAIAALVLALIGWANMMNRIDRFIANIPFMLTWVVAYAVAWRLPPLMLHYAERWSLEPWLVLSLIGLIGMLLLVLLASVWALWFADFTTATLFTLIWGWYAVFFLILMCSPGSDTDEAMG